MKTNGFWEGAWGAPFFNLIFLPALSALIREIRGKNARISLCLRASVRDGFGFRPYNLPPAPSPGEVGADEAAEADGAGGQSG